MHLIVRLRLLLVFFSLSPPPRGVLLCRFSASSTSTVECVYARTRVCGGGLIQHSDSSELTRGLRGAEEEEDTATRGRDDRGESACARREGRGGDEDGIDSIHDDHHISIVSTPAVDQTCQCGRSCRTLYGVRSTHFHGDF
jgi:hypothetical protein